MSIADPLGLLDRDLTNFDTAYDTCVSHATERMRIMVDWYREFAGHDPADSDMAHGEWRISVERLRWLTMRGALQEAWPLPAHPIPPSPNPPPVGDMRRLVPQHHYFVKDGGERFTVICATDFCLQKMCCEGRDVHPVLAQRQACGFNMVRVFIAQDWGDDNYRVRPDQHAGVRAGARRSDQRITTSGWNVAGHTLAGAGCDKTKSGNYLDRLS